MLFFSESIFFLENSERETLFPLALCSLESAALHNPKTTVLLLRTSYGPTLWTSELQSIAMNYPNIRLQTIMADSVVLETPVTSLWYGNKMERSRYGLSHTRLAISCRPKSYFFVFS